MKVIAGRFLGLSVGYEPGMKVSGYVRTILAVFALFGVWQVAWLNAQRPTIEPLLPTVMNVSGWIFAWGVVLGFCAAGSVSGHDFWARCGFGAMSVTSVMGAVTVAADALPLSIQFWYFGQAVVLALACFVMLVSPMRNPPHRFEDGFPS